MFNSRGSERERERERLYVDKLLGTFSANWHVEAISLLNKKYDRQAKRNRQHPYRPLPGPSCSKKKRQSRQTKKNMAKRKTTPTETQGGRENLQSFCINFRSTLFLSLAG